MNFVVDESVSYAVVRKLRKLDHKVISIAESPLAGIQDEDVYKLTVKEKSILITRDFHFTNSLRFPPQNTNGVIYIRSGNLRAEEETNLINKLLKFHNLGIAKGRLLTLYRDNFKIR